MVGTVSIVNQPDTYAPVNGELWYRVDSASSSTTDFKYVFNVRELNQLSGAVTDRGLYKVPPRPDSYGIFTPHKILRASTSYNLQPTITGFNKAEESIVRYNIKYGFEYNPGLTWSDTQFSTGLVGLTFSTPHGLQVGDLIILNKDNKVLNPSYDGTASVMTVPSTYNITTDIPWGDNSTNEGGTITSILRLTATSSDRWAFNGTRQYLERSLDFSSYVVSNTGKILNGYTKWKPIYEYQDETLSLLVNNATYSVGKAWITTYDSALNIVATYSSSTYSVNNAYRRVDFGSGTKNLVGIGASFSNIKYYTVQFGTSSSTLYTNGDDMIARYEIVSENCFYDNYRIVWLNRNGAFNYWNFSLDSKKSISVQSKTYNRIPAWDYSIGDRGETTLANTVKEKWTINTDWIDEYTASWMEELFSSPEVYHIDNSGNILPIIIEDKSYEVKTANRNQIFNITLNFTYAYDIRLQNN